MFTTVNKTIGDPGKRDDLNCLKLQLSRFAGLNLTWVYRYIRLKRFHVPDLCRNEWLKPQKDPLGMISVSDSIEQ